jgi:hypothetical protein
LIFKSCRYPYGYVGADFTRSCNLSQAFIFVENKI